MGFKAEAAKATGIDPLNSGSTVYGGLDAIRTGQEASRLVGLSNKTVPYGSSFQAATSAGHRMPASGALGHFGGALAAFGLGANVGDMVQNGVTVDNALSATTNALSTGAWAASTLGAAGGTAHQDHEVLDGVRLRVARARHKIANDNQGGDR